MKTINSDFIRSYDKFKDDVFHAKKQEFKTNLRSQNKKVESPIPKKIFPWRTLTKIVSLAGIVYFAYNYTDYMINNAIQKKIITKVDLISLYVIKQDALVKIHTLFRKPHELNKLSHFSNYLYQDRLQNDLLYLNKIDTPHKLKSTLQTRFKLWIFQFTNYEKCQYINEFGDIVEREQNSLLRIWRYPIWKNRKQKVVKQQKVHRYYRTIFNAGQSQRQQQTTIKKEISNKCQRINILNKFNSDYDQLVVQCRKNQNIGNSIIQLLKQRKKLYIYPDMRAQNN